VPSPLLAPRAWPFHALALLLVAAAGWLGLWQYDAWQAHRAAEARDLTRSEPVALAEVFGPDDPFPADRVGQPVILSGTWLPAQTVYVTGRERAGVPGAWVVTPLVVGPGDSALLVVRGWVPATDLPPAAGIPDPPRGPAEFVGLLQPGEGTGAVDDDPDDDLLPQVRIADMLQRLDRDLYGGYAVVAEEVAPGAWPHGADALNDGTAGLAAASVDQLPPVGRFTALRNLLYAVEWWVFGLFAAFLWWRWTRDEVEAERFAAEG